MLTVGELFTRLSYGPLVNLAISNEGAGGIIETKQPSMVHHTNEALLRLYGKFILKENEAIIRMLDGVSNYKLVPEHTYVNSTGSSTTFIMDSKSKPFLNDVIKILNVYDAAGCKLPINDENHSGSVFTPTPISIQFPRNCPNELMFVMYQARHPELSSNPVKLNQVIDIPDVLEEALISYIAYKVLGNMNGQEHQAKAQTHYNNYELVCNTVRENDLVNSSISSSRSGFEQRGFR